jgi:hypothetical protein
LSAVLGGTASAAGAPVPIQRFLLVIGANAGGGDRAKLQYAISDAERFARVMVELGGVLPANEVVLKQPRLKELVDALDALNARVKDARRGQDAGRIEVIVYYSGHADEQGLLLAGDRYAYRTLRDWLDAIPADVRIAVLDACASGAFTRLKGGRLRAPFLVDESATMRGHAFLTSSAETETAQESDRIRASYFTHYLISGFRGAADLSGDGKVTLNEAYQFALNETLGRTIDTRGGAQHLSGSGDLVMTDVRQTTATLVLGEDLDGRIFVRNAARELIVEVNKPAGRKVELGVEPGAYEIRLERPPASMTARTRVADGGSVTLEARQFGPAALEPTRTRGNAGPAIPLAVAGRNRINLRLGGTLGSPAYTAAVGSAAYPVASSSVTDPNLLIGLEYGHYVREDIAVVFQITGHGGLVGQSLTSQGVYTADVLGLMGLQAGVRWNPFARRNPASAFKPYVGASIGPYLGSSVVSAYVGPGILDTGVQTGATTVGGVVGGGLDLHMGRPFVVGLDAGYRWMADFDRLIGARDNYSGGQVAISFGFMFGKGR